MTVLISIGRRVPRNWFKRKANQAAGFVGFQENLWLIIKQSLNIAKRNANASDTLKFVITNETEQEDLHYQIQWIKVVIVGDRKQEEEEYNESLQLYKRLNKIFKKKANIKGDSNISKQFKTKILSSSKIEEAYEAGYGAMGDNNLANKMLEMGIITHIEWVKDFDSRDKIAEA